MGTNDSETTDKRKYCKPLPWANGPYFIFIVQQHALTIDENSVPDTTFINRATVASSSRTNGNDADEQNAMEEKNETVTDNSQAPESEVGQRERCDTDNTYIHLTHTGKEKIDALQLR